MRKMEQWVKTHSINGPSPIAFTTERANELHLFYDIDNDAWSILDNLAMSEYVKGLFGIYYVVFKDEYIKYLNRI